MSPTADADLGLDVSRVPMADGAGTLHVRHGGPTDAAPVLLLHGFPETGFGWRHQVGPLRDAGYRVLVPDQRGYGRSDRPRGVSHYVVDRMVDDAIAVLDALGEGRAAHVVGHDWGGAVAWQLARTRPEAVRSLTVCNCPPADVLLRAPLFDPVQLLRSWYILFFQLPWLPERLLHRGAGLRLLQDALDDKDEAAVYREAWSDPDAWRAALDWYRAAMRRRARRPGPAHAPTLLLWGSGDEALGDSLAGPALGAARDGRLLRIAEADGRRVGHWTPSRGRRTVTPALLHHLATHGGADPFLYRIVTASAWEEAADPWPGGPLDLQDGFLHLSTAAQVPGTLARFFADVPDVRVLAVDPRKLDPETLRWEVGPDGGPFPHLYGPLPHEAVVEVRAP